MTEIKFMQIEEVAMKVSGTFVAKQDYDLLKTENDCMKSVCEAARELLRAPGREDLDSGTCWNALRFRLEELDAFERFHGSVGIFDPAKTIKRGT